MGYYANGSGYATIKEEKVEELETFLEKATGDLKNVLRDISTEIYSDTIDICERDSHWHAYDTTLFLNALIPYITEGCVEYSGEDGCRWRYVFNPETNEWEEQSGSIYYTEKDMIEELERLGYKVTKESKQAA